MCHFEEWSYIIRHYPVKFGNHRAFVIRDMIFCLSLDCIWSRDWRIVWLCAQWLNITSTSILLSISSLVAKKGSCRDRYIMLLFFTRPLWLVTALTSHQPVKFSKYRHHSENMFLIFHVTWCVHVISRLCNFVDIIKFLAPYHIPPFSQVWWPQLSWKWRYNAFSLPYGLMYPRDQLVLWVVDKILSLES